MSCSVFESNSCARHPKDKHRDDLCHHTLKPTEDIKILLITLCICTTPWWTISSSWKCTATCSKTKFTKSKSTQNLEPAVLEVYYQFTTAVALKSPQRNLKKIAFFSSYEHNIEQKDGMRSHTSSHKKAENLDGLIHQRREKGAGHGRKE
jgi:hypothetical protein